MRTRTKVLIALVVATLVGANILAAEQPPTTPRPVSKKAADDLDAWRYSNIQWAKQVVAKVLRDPDSAQFRDVTVVAPQHFDSKCPARYVGM